MQVLHAAHEVTVYLNCNVTEALVIKMLLFCKTDSSLELKLGSRASQFRFTVCVLNSSSIRQNNLL